MITPGAAVGTRMGARVPVMPGPVPGLTLGGLVPVKPGPVPGVTKLGLQSGTRQQGSLGFTRRTQAGSRLGKLWHLRMETDVGQYSACLE